MACNLPPSCRRGCRHDLNRRQLADQPVGSIVESFGRKIATCLFGAVVASDQQHLGQSANSSADHRSDGRREQNVRIEEHAFDAPIVWVTHLHFPTVGGGRDLFVRHCPRFREHRKIRFAVDANRQCHDRLQDDPTAFDGDLKSVTALEAQSFANFSGQGYLPARSDLSQCHLCRISALVIICNHVITAKFALLRADNAAGDARNPYRAVVFFVGADVGDDGFRDPLPRRFIDLLQCCNCE